MQQPIWSAFWTTTFKTRKRLAMRTVRARGQSSCYSRTSQNFSGSLFRNISPIKPRATVSRSTWNSFVYSRQGGAYDIVKLVCRFTRVGEGPQRLRSPARLTQAYKTSIKQILSSHVLD